MDLGPAINLIDGRVFLDLVHFLDGAAERPLRVVAVVEGVRLVDVGVGLHEARNDGPAVQVDGRFGFDVQALADPVDLSSLDEDVAGGVPPG